jgi:hypothetical protein
LVPDRATTSPPLVLRDTVPETDVTDGAMYDVVTELDTPTTPPTDTRHV